MLLSSNFRASLRARIRWQHFLEMKNWLANKHKKILHSLEIREMQIKIVMKYNFVANVTIWQNQILARKWEYKLIQSFGKYGRIQKNRTCAYPTVQQLLAQKYSPGNVHRNKNVYSYIVHYNKKWETSQCLSILQWINHYDQCMQCSTYSYPSELQLYV